MRLHLKKYSREIHANVAMIAAIVFPVLFFVIAFAVETQSLSNQRSTLQRIVDETALSMVNELSVTSQGVVDLQTMADLHINAALSSHDSLHELPRSITVGTNKDESEDERDSLASDSNLTVSVSLSQTPVAYFQTIFGWPEVKPVIVSASARRFGTTNLCVIGLATQHNMSLVLNARSELYAPNCTVYSNADTINSVSVASAADLTASEVSIVGGAETRDGGITPPPKLNQPPISDPMANWNPDLSDITDNCENPSRSLATLYQISTSGVTLLSGIPWKDGHFRIEPGYYCKGLRVGDDMTVDMEPGIYVFGGPASEGADPGGTFLVQTDATVTGENVSLFFNGERSILHVYNDADINLTATKTGEMRGVLMSEIRTHQRMEHHVKTNGANNLVGTIYLPRSSFVVDTNGSVAEDSEYTAIIASAIILHGNANLHLNTDYGATDVPVPPGVGPIGSDGAVLVD